MRSRQDPVGPRAVGAGRELLPASFFDRSTARVARELLGHRLVRVGLDGPARVARLVETEAYLRNDPASHAFRGPSPRNRSMFGPPGTLYVFSIHQVFCANVVTRRGEAVLLRAAEPLAGIDGSLSGPGRLARGLGLTRDHDGTAVTGPGPLQLVRGRGRRGPVAVGPRVGISRARELPLRFCLVESPAVSRPRPPLPGACRAGLA